MRRMLSRVATIVLVAVLSAAKSDLTASAAGTTVQILYTGSGTGAYAGTSFAGCIQYDQSKPKTSARFFNFQASGYHHEICYTTSTSLYGSGFENNCDPFTIDLSADTNTTMKVSATAQGTTSLTVWLPTTQTFNALSLLPFCQAGTPPTNVFKGTGTFQLATGGHVTYTGSITTTTFHCSQITSSGPHCPPCTAVAPAPTYPCPTPEPCPVYTCAPRPSCCLTRLFARLSCRNRCW
jgi:hypothetical protein